jgi:hypothetical protein
MRAGSTRADENSFSDLTSSILVVTSVLIVEPGSIELWPEAQQVAEKIQTVHHRPVISLYFDITAVLSPIKAQR